jgi:hypothetical protein
MGRLSHSSLFSFQTEKCCCSIFKKEDSKACCKDEHELIALDNDQSQAPLVSTPAPQFFELGPAYRDLMFLQTSSHVEPAGFFYSDSSPPARPPLFKLNCCFVFYA